ncbi:MAG: aminotransferase class III-fold pyridoxal phosphate-dependent enzyme [Alteromonadaceae bacterium]|nr:aminotransferase class III-fold pyridoxal phosphate-dependent enzyme [Alteromonadaceae bacterium]
MKKLQQGSGAKLWQKAKKIIPGGNQLLSKRAEMFLPEFWPAYYKKAKGCEIWDLDNNHYYDLSIMGIGSCVLGYSHPEINDVVIDAIHNGSMSSLNCYEEVDLAEKLIQLHPWSDSVRFARTGGESCAIAVRIARSYTKKEKIIFCGYHGWHDWYLATNLKDDKNLDEQLLPGLAPDGVPKSLTGTVIPFKNGDITTFKKILAENKNECASVVMEVFRNSAPDIEFLKEIKQLCKQEKIVLIYDEISSGFRLNVGASHLLWDINPDICVLGKALGNGHPIGAIIGKRKIMDAAQSSFISSTYWTERVGFAAALTTLDIFERDNVIIKVNKTGAYIKENLLKLATNTEFNLDVLGIDSALVLDFQYKNPLLVKTIFTQEMLKRGFLASNVIYVSIAHTVKIVDLYLSAVKEVFTLISHADKSNQLQRLLEGPICHSGFSRLN